MKEITIEEATKTISEWPNQDDFITRNYRMWYDHDFGMGDNSIELADYWQSCYDMITPPQADK